MRIKNLLPIFQFLIMTTLLSNCVLPIGPNWRTPQSETIETFGIGATLWTDHYCYLWGEPIQVRFSLENITPESILLGGKAGLPFDIVLHRTTAQYEVRWSETASGFDSIELKPGELYEIEWEVTLPDKENDYRIYGELGPVDSSVHISMLIQNLEFCPERAIPLH